MFKKHKYTQSILIQLRRKLNRMYGRESFEVEETEEPVENLRPRMGDHYDGVCQNQESNRSRSGDKRETYLCASQAP